MPLLTAQGATITFNGATLGKYQGVVGSFKTPLKEIRPLANQLDEGGRYLATYESTTCDQTTNLEALCTGFNTAIIGAKAALSVTGTGWSWSFPYAILEDFQITGKVGEYLRIVFMFRRSFE